MEWYTYKSQKLGSVSSSLTYRTNIMEYVVKLTMKEMQSIAQWLKDRGLSDNVPVTIKSDQTGIGTTLMVLVETRENEGIWKDFTDYDSW